MSFYPGKNIWHPKNVYLFFILLYSLIFFNGIIRNDPVGLKDLALILIKGDLFPKHMAPSR